MVKEIVPGGGEHLSNDILIKIAQVGGQLVAEEVLVDDVLRESLVPEGKGNESSILPTLLKIFSTQKHKILKIYSPRFRRILKKL